MVVVVVVVKVVKVVKVVAVVVCWLWLRWWLCVGCGGGCCVCLCVSVCDVARPKKNLGSTQQNSKKKKKP